MEWTESEREFDYLAIAGSRNWTDAKRVEEVVRAQRADVVIVTGGARGVDKYAEAACKKLGRQYARVPALWSHFGKKAGYVRNRVVVDMATSVIVFWDGHSPGTLDVINKAKGLGKPLIVYRSDEPPSPGPP